MSLILDQETHYIASVGASFDSSGDTIPQNKVYLLAASVPEVFECLSQ